MKKRTVSLITMTLLLFALSLPHESFAQNGKWKKLARKAAAFTVGVIATSQGEDAATAMEATTWALGGDESEMSENSRMANYTVQDLKEDVSYKIGETIVNRQEEKEQQAMERRREERRIEEQYDNEYNKNYDGEVLAESWELSCHPDGPSVIINGQYAGSTLKEYIEAEGNKVLGANCEKFEDFPILIKFIDAKDNLSIQKSFQYKHPYRRNRK